MADSDSTPKTQPMIIYGLYDPHTDELRYVGKTVKGLQARLRAHVSAARIPTSTSYNNHSARWIRSLGDARPIAKQLETCLSIDALDDLERKWIAWAKTTGSKLTNQTDGGDGSIGCSPSPETRQKNRAGRLGKTHSAEARERIRLARLGTQMPPWTPEHREQMAMAQRGKTHTAETRAKISAAKPGKHLTFKRKSPPPHSPEHRSKTAATLARLWALEHNPWEGRSTAEFCRKQRDNALRQTPECRRNAGLLGWARRRSKVETWAS